MSDWREKANAIERICKACSERLGVRMATVDGLAILRDDRSDSFNVAFEKDGLFASCSVPADASPEHVDAAVSGTAQGLIRQVECYHEGRYEPEIYGPSEKAWRACRENWLAKREGRSRPHLPDEIEELSREYVVSVDANAGDVRTAMHPLPEGDDT